MKPSTVFRGFMLMELPVVIGIIAVRIAALLPVLNKAREAALQTKCQSNLRQCAVAFMYYANNNRQRIIVGATQSLNIGSWPQRMYGYD